MAFSASHSLRQRLLFGEISKDGFSIQSFQRSPAPREELAWNPEADSVVLIFNTAAQLELRREIHSTLFPTDSHGLLRMLKDPWRMIFAAGHTHRLLTLHFSVDWLRLQLNLPGKNAAKTIWTRLGGFSSGVSDIRPMSVYDHQLIAQLTDPPVSEQGRTLWYQARMMEMVSHFFFMGKSPEAPFCVRQKRVAGDRVERVKEVLLENMADPPDLAELGRRVGCSPYYLSRTFSRATGMTIQKYLQRLRMEEAARLLRSGRCNVTEAAMEVGYNSLSHFSKVFCEAMGCCPCLYRGNLSSSRGEES